MSSFGEKRSVQRKEFNSEDGREAMRKRLPKPIRLTEQRPAHNAPAQGDLIGVLQVASDRNAPGDHAHFNGGGLNSFVNIKSRGVAFHGGTQCQDHFPDSRLSMIEAADKRFNVQVGWANAIHRRNYAPEYMIEAVILGRIFNGHHVAGILHYTNQVSVALAAQADRAYFVVRNIMAGVAEPDLGTKAGE